MEENKITDDAGDNELINDTRDELANNDMGKELLNDANKKELVGDTEEEPVVEKNTFSNKVNKGLKKVGGLTIKSFKKAKELVDNKVINPIKENLLAIKEMKAENNALNEAFKKQSEIFSIIYLDKEKKIEEIHCIIDEDNHLLKTNFDIVNPTEIECIQDSRKQPYYSIHVKSAKSKFKVEYNNKEIEMELFNLEYSTNKPQEPLPTTYIDNRVDNSIKAGKKAIIGDNNDIKKETSVSVELKFPKL